MLKMLWRTTTATATASTASQTVLVSFLHAYKGIKDVV
jgi:hypothetical protein